LFVKEDANVIQTEAAVSVNGLEKSYKNPEVLKNIHFTVKKGSIFAGAQGYSLLPILLQCKFTNIRRHKSFRAISILMV
jgi:ABC-type histidine transport system ATPase subunit